jgi:hypothetical protein
VPHLSGVGERRDTRQQPGVVAAPGWITGVVLDVDGGFTSL